MYSYLIGKVTEIFSNAISLEVNNVGYLIYVANPYSYELEKTYKVYIYNKIGEEEYSLYGFKNHEEYDFFTKLISVKGLGPKLALPIIATGSISGVADAIERANVLYLTKFPKIGDKLARQMILDLKGKIDTSAVIDDNDNTEDLIETLSALGYKTQDIKRVISQVDKTSTLENQVKEALKLMLS